MDENVFFWQVLDTIVTGLVREMTKTVCRIVANSIAQNEYEQLTRCGMVWVSQKNSICLIDKLRACQNHEH